MMIVAIVNEAMFLYAENIAFDRFERKNGHPHQNYPETLASMLKLTSVNRREKNVNCGGND